MMFLWREDLGHEERCYQRRRSKTASVRLISSWTDLNAARGKDFRRWHDLGFWTRRFMRSRAREEVAIKIDWSGQG